MEEILCAVSLHNTLFNTDIYLKDLEIKMIYHES